MSIKCRLLGHKFVCRKCGKEQSPATWTADLTQTVQMLADYRIREMLGDVGAENPRLATELKQALTRARLRRGQG